MHSMAPLMCIIHVSTTFTAQSKAFGFNDVSTSASGSAFLV